MSGLSEKKEGFPWEPRPEIIRGRIPAVLELVSEESLPDPQLYYS